MDEKINVHKLCVRVRVCVCACVYVHLFIKEGKYDEKENKRNYMENKK